MRYSTMSLIVFLTLIILNLTSCEKDPVEPKPETGRLVVLLTDAPATFNSVNITFSQVSAHIDTGWVIVNGEAVTVDLLEWNNGKVMTLGDAEMPVGHYTQIRLLIDAAAIVVDGQEHELDVPSGAQTGLKFGPEFTIEEGSTYELVIDFDVVKSIVINGPKDNPIGYKLKPHIRVTPKAITGSISGTVANASDAPIAYAIQGDDTTTTSIVDVSNGYFMLSFLPEGSYTVAVEDTLGKSSTKSGVSVSAGEDTDLGSITLQEPAP